MSAPLNPMLGQSIATVPAPSKPVVLQNITLPILISATWSDQELHSYGSVFGVTKNVGSENKWLYTHGGLKWQRFYSEDAVAFSKNVLRLFPKGRLRQDFGTPPVRLEVRDNMLGTCEKYTFRYENEWPIARTEYKKLYLDANTKTMSFDKVVQEGKVTYQSADGAAVFSIKFDEDTELTGYMAMNLFVSPDEANDMDLMVKLRKLDANGKVVYFPAWHAPTTYEVASGWWRLSWRELDPNKSRPFQPIPTFGTPQKVNPGDIVEAKFSIYPSSTLFHKGETLQVFIAGSNQYGVVNARFAYEFLNMGKHSIYTGGNYDSYLLVPVVPQSRLGRLCVLVHMHLLAACGQRMAR